MAVNSSSSSNDSLLPPTPPSGMYCLLTSPNFIIFTTYHIINTLLLLPLCILVLYLGLQRWQRQRSTSTAAVTSHSDIFTYHMIAMELIGLLGCTFICCCIYVDCIILSVGYHLWAFTWYGQLFFHSLTCVERYLAVIHPVTYLSLRGERGIRIRNISIGCVWLLCVVEMGLINLDNSLTIDIFLLCICLIIVALCSLSVLYILIRPGPGEQGGDRERVDQSKQRAFYTMIAILGVLLLRSFGSLLWTALEVVMENQCVAVSAEALFLLPSSLVLPLLFLQRAGILACCKN